VLMTAQASTDSVAVARAVAAAARDWRLPVAAAFVGGARVAAGARQLEAAGIPAMPFPSPLCERWAAWRAWPRAALGGSEAR